MTNLAHVTINLDRMDGTDNVRGGYVVFDPRVDVPHVPTHIHVQAVTVVLDDTGRGETDLVAGVPYAATSNRLRSGYTIAPLTAGQTVDLSQVITTGTPLTPSEGAALAARIAVLEDAPPGSYDDTAHTHPVAQVSDSTTVGRTLVTAADAAAARAAIGAGTSNLALGTTSTTAKAGDYAPEWSEVTGKPTTFAPSAHAHDAGDITSGVLATARLGTGTPSASTVLYGDGAWKAAPTGGGGSGSGLSGTGSPEGVVTAPVGTEYLDTAGTVGAWRWLKASGTGNTGWVVTYGDTGWRALAPGHHSSTASWSSGNLLIRRVTGRVSVYCDGMAMSANGTVMGTFTSGAGDSAGFQPINYSVLMPNLSKGMSSADWDGAGWPYYGGVGHLRGETSFIAKTHGGQPPWPTILPGTPV